MDNNGLSFFAILFLAFLALSAALIVWMFISLVRLGDERRQLIVGKACTFSFMGGWQGTCFCAPWCSCWARGGSSSTP